MRLGRGELAPKPHLAPRVRATSIFALRSRNNLAEPECSMLRPCEGYAYRLGFVVVEQDHAYQDEADGPDPGEDAAGAIVWREA